MCYVNHLLLIYVVCFFTDNIKTLFSASNTEKRSPMFIFQPGTSVAGAKPLHCFRVHHWMVNTVLRSPFFQNIILTVGEWNFAIWREEVMVTHSYRLTLRATNSLARIKDSSPGCVFFSSAPRLGGSHHPVSCLWANLHCRMLVPVQTRSFLHWKKGRQHRGVEPTGEDKRACAYPGSAQQCQDHLYETLDLFM